MTRNIIINKIRLLLVIWEAKIKINRLSSILEVILVIDISAYKDLGEKLSSKQFSYTSHFHYKKNDILGVT